MRNFWLFSCIFILFSCKKKDQPLPVDIPSISSGSCTYMTKFSAPANYNLQTIDSIEANVHIKAIQFPSESVGYLLAGNNVGSYAEVFRTNDGGRHWQDLSLDFDESPLNLLFLDENIGILSHYGGKGNLMRTTDGGNTWQPHNSDNLNGNLYHLTKDVQGNIYSIVFGIDLPTIIVKSIDKGLIWTVFKEGLDIDFSLFRPGIHMANGHIYVTTHNGQIVVLDDAGQIVKTIETEVERLWDITFIDEQNFILVDSDKVIKSNDGGLTWQEIHDRTARIIEFDSPDEGWMLLNKSYCNTDVYQANDVLAYTDDGGLTWQESEERTNWMLDYHGHNRNLAGDFVIVFDKNIFQLKQ